MSYVWHHGIPVSCPVPPADRPAPGRQIVQVCHGLSHGEKFLGQGKVGPIPASDAPGHMAGDLIGRQPRLSPERLHGVLHPPGVVGRQLVHPCRQVPGLAFCAGLLSHSAAISSRENPSFTYSAYMVRQAQSRW